MNGSRTDDHYHYHDSSAPCGRHFSASHQGLPTAGDPAIDTLRRPVKATQSEPTAATPRAGGARGRSHFLQHQGHCRGRSVALLLHQSPPQSAPRPPGSSTPTPTSAGTSASTCTSTSTSPRTSPSTSTSASASASAGTGNGTGKSASISTGISSSASASASSGAGSSATGKFFPKTL